MTPSDPDPGRRRVLWGTAAVLGFLGLVVWGLTPPSPAPFHEKVAELRAAGYATTFAEHLGPPPPDDENAAVEIVAAWEAVVAAHGTPYRWGVTGPWDSEAVHPWAENASAEQMQALAAFLDRIAPQIDRMERATTRPRLWFRESRDGAVSGTGDAVTLLQNVQKVLVAEAGAGRDPRRRLAASAALLRIGAMDDPATAIDAVVHAAIASTGVTAVRILVEDGLVPASDARAACDAALRPRLTDRFPHIVRGEIGWVAEVYERFLRGDLPTGGLAVRGPFSRARLATLLRDLFDGAVAAETPAEVAELLDRSRRASALPTTNASELHDELRILSGDGAGRATRSVVHSPWMPQVVRHLARSDATRALARVALAAAEFRERKGRWPESLAALAPMFPEGVPVDPCDGKPFDYVVADGRVRLSARGQFPGAKADPDRSARDDLLVWEFGPR